jgi:hypothetical protein
MRISGIGLAIDNAGRHGEVSVKDSPKFSDSGK